MRKEVHRVNNRASQKILVGTLLFSLAPLVGGCVVLEEKYNAEKARSLNFQRLLAQEEKRTAELDSEVKRTKNELAEFEARNRELVEQVQAVRDQMARLQEEAEAIRESALLERKAMEEMQRSGPPSAKSKKPESPVEISDDLAGVQSDLSEDLGAKDKDMGGTAELGLAAEPGVVIHVVKAGETLFRISRRYEIEVEKLKELNKLPDDIIEVGQRLIVGTE